MVEWREKIFVAVGNGATEQISDSAPGIRRFVDKPTKSTLHTSAHWRVPNHLQGFMLLALEIAA
jgi:hypothetical protein